MSRFTTDEILGQLDKAAENFQFPMLDNGYIYPVDQRLHVFGDTDRWAIVIETLGYNPRAGNLFDTLEKFGNCVGSPGAANVDFIGRLDNADELWDLEQNAHPWSDASGLVVRGTRIPIPARGPTASEPWDILRDVVPAHRILFLASEDELRSRVPADLTRLLMLTEWNHPDIRSGEKPSESQTFQMIAAVLVSGEPDRYAPRSSPNTDWSKWPEGGTL